MRDQLPFPNGHNPTISLDKKIKCKGILDKSLKDKTVIIKGITEGDILEIREMLIEEIKRQKKEEKKETED